MDHGLLVAGEVVGEVRLGLLDRLGDAADVPVAEDAPQAGEEPGLVAVPLHVLHGEVVDECLACGQPPGCHLHVSCWGVAGRRSPPGPGSQVERDPNARESRAAASVTWRAASGSCSKVRRTLGASIPMQPTALPGGVEHGSRDAAGVGGVLLVVEGVAPGADVREMGLEGIGIGDGPRGPLGQRRGDLGEPPGEEALPRRGGVERDVASRARDDAERLVGLDVVDHEHPSAVRDGDVGALAGLGDQLLEERPRRLLEPFDRARQLAVPPERGPQHVAVAAVGRGRRVAGIHERPEEPQGGRLVDLDLGRDGLDGDAPIAQDGVRVGLEEHVEDLQAAGERADRFHVP